MIFTLLQNQLGIFGAEQLSNDGSNYNLEIITKLDQRIDLVRLKKALDAVVTAHPYINVHLVQTPDQNVCLELPDNISFDAPIFDIDDTEIKSKQLDHPYDLFNDRLFRLEIYRTPNGNYLYTNFSI